MKKKFHLLPGLLVFCLLTSQLQSQSCIGPLASNSIVPQSHTICAGSIASMSLAYNYTSTGLTYQWYASSVSSSGPFSPISGATLTSFTSPPLNANMYYQLIITCSTDNSSITLPHSVSVYSCTTPCSGTPGTTSIVPSSTSICAGDLVSFSLTNTYSTTTGLNFQWSQGSSSSGSFTAIPGATLTSFTSPTLNAGSTYFAVYVTCSNSNLSYSTTCGISVNTCTYCSGTPAQNFVTPSSQTVCIGSTASMSLVNTYTASGISYQWQSSAASPAGPFSSIPGATLSSYTTAALSSNVFYNVVITCSNSGLSSQAGDSVIVESCAVPCNGQPASTNILPLNHTVCIGNTATMSLSTSYTDTGITYQWESSTSLSGPYTSIAGATLSSYTSGPLFSDTYFKVIITCTNTNQYVEATHRVLVYPCVNCSGPPSSNSIVPLTYSLCSGSSASLSLANSYTVGGITYQWGSSSSSALGPFAPITGATLSAYTTSILTTNMYFNVIISCSQTNENTQAVRGVDIFTCTGLPYYADENEELMFEAFPNPTHGSLTIRTKLFTTAELLISDLSGRTIYQGSYEGKSLQFQLPALTSGVYFLQLHNQTKLRVIKIFIFD